MRRYNDRRLRQLGTFLLKWQRERGENWAWEWLDVDRISERRANKFLLGCMIDYYQRSETAWRKARELAEVELGDRGNLWKRILRIHPRMWAARSGPEQLHPVKQRHKKVRAMARQIMEDYGGDARAIWRNRPPKEIQDRLEDLGLGPSLSRMAIGGLKDHGFVEGKWDVKPDVNLNRIVGRLTAGEVLPPERTLEITRKMAPRDPWKLDRPLFDIGISLCFAEDPSCRFCPLAKVWCLYNARQRSS